MAERFLRAAQTSLIKLAASPQMGWRRESSDPRLATVRTWRIDGFEKHLIFYQPTGHGILVLRILYGSRDVPTHLRLLLPNE